jgi:uncharacterized phage protein (TIGR02220 family)
MDWFIDHAAYEEKEVYLPRFGVIKLNRGEVIFGSKKLAQLFRVSRKRIRTRLTVLTQIGFLTQKRANKAASSPSIAFVTKYALYQDAPKQKGQQKGRKGANKGPTRGQQGATNNTLKYISNTLIRHLNKISGRNFKPETNIKYVMPRLNEGFTKEQCLCVIEKKWLDPDFDRAYYCPETLFRPTKFEKYLNQDINRKRINKADKIALANAQKSFEWLKGGKDE